MRLKSLKRLYGTIFLILGAGVIGFPQESNQGLKNEMEALKQEIQGIRKELQEIRDMIQAGQNPQPSVPNIQNIEFELGRNPVMGMNTAGLTMVEFTDYQCPYCARYAQETLSEIVNKFVDSGKIRYAIFDLPLSIHKLAFKAAEASRCARDQGKYWEMHDQMMANQSTLDDLVSNAESVNLDLTRFKSCMDSNKYTDEVSDDMNMAKLLGISGTPSFVLAVTDQEDPTKIKGFSIIRGNQPFAAFEHAINHALDSIQK